ncbi:MAG: PEP-CTERM sorting domain-containing protein, partial [Planctomycetota bacterium]
GLGFALQEINGEPVVFSDIAADGEVPFNVSEPLLIGMTDHWGAFDAGFDPARTRQLASAANWNSLYTDRVGGPLGGGGSPVRTQIGPIGGNPLLELNVVGMPAMQGRVVVMDARPTNNAVQQILDPDNADPDANLRTFNYAPGAGYSPGLNNIDPFDPGIVPTDLHVSLSYADFGQFTSITPGGIKPALAENPFIGPNPLLNDPNDTTPPVTLSANGQSVDGSWLLDTGAAASFVSQESASQIGVSYDPNNPLGSDSPRLLGVDSDDQFTLQITGIAGNPTVVSGFYADNLLLRTDEGNPTDDLDPNHINYRGAPVLVLDIAVFDEVAQEEIILDGIFGMNYLIASTDLLQSPGDIFPIFFNPAETPFDYVVFDEPGGKLGLTLDGDNLPTPGDANRDGDVNLADFLILRDNFGDDDANFYDADFNGDNVVDLADFLILRDNFGSSDTGDMNAWLATVPEPASMGLVFALGGLALRRRR